MFLKQNKHKFIHWKNMVIKPQLTIAQSLAFIKIQQAL